MISRNQIALASKRAEAWLELVDTVAALGKLARIDPAIEILNVLHAEHLIYGNRLQESLPTFAVLSDGPVRWVGGSEHDDPTTEGQRKFHIWASAHEAALEITRIALALLYPLIVVDADVHVRRALAERLLIERWRTIATPPDELAVLRERIRRERWKVVQQRRR